MMTSRFFLTVCLALSLFLSVTAQNSKDFEKFKAQRAYEFNKYRSSEREKFEAFRRKRNEKYAELMKKRWMAIESIKGIEKPIEEQIVPIIWPEENEGNIKSEPLPIKNVLVPPQPKPQPKPIEPILERPVTTPVSDGVEFTYFGTKGEVRIGTEGLFKLKSLNERNIADAWIEMSDEKYTNLLHDCLKIRDAKKLCDWAYLMMLQAMAEAVCGSKTNESVLLMSYVYCQSGYKMRLGFDAGKLYMLYASEHTIYEQPYFNIEGERYYVLHKNGGNIHICNQAFPKEKPMSLFVTNNQEFAYKKEKSTQRSSTRYSDININVGINKNLLQFYNSYPTSMIGDNIVSRWALYANTPMAKEVCDQLYPVLKNALVNCDPLTAVNKLLNFVQTGFRYEYDEKVWGHDRAFFAEETLYYPYADCEDRSILFSRLVRDLLHLDVILVYYPGHLATAVELPQETEGDYLIVNQRKFIVCDPTYIGAPVGRTMKNMNNRSATVILLEK